MELLKNLINQMKEEGNNSAKTSMPVFHFFRVLRKETDLNKYKCAAY